MSARRDRRQKLQRQDRPELDRNLDPERERIEVKINGDYSITSSISMGRVVTNLTNLVIRLVILVFVLTRLIQG